MRQSARGPELVDLLQSKVVSKGAVEVATNSLEVKYLTALPDLMDEAAASEAGLMTAKGRLDASLEH